MRSRPSRPSPQSMANVSRITGISSMATRAVLTELAAGFQHSRGVEVSIESVGGVEAARRVSEGERFDLVLLASEAIDRLMAAGHLLPDSKVDVVQSGVAIAVPQDDHRPDIGSEDALKAAVLGATRIGYSTGPSGTQLLRLFERWGIAAQLQGRLIQAPPGVPVGLMVAKREVALGFQQLSELIHLDGIAILGPMPPQVPIDTTFSVAIGVASTQVSAARELIAYLTSAEAAPIQLRHGMTPA